MNILDLPNEVLQEIISLSGNIENFKFMNKNSLARFSYQSELEKQFFCYKDEISPIFVKKLFINMDDIEKVDFSKYTYVETLFLYSDFLSGKYFDNYNSIWNYWIY